MSISADDIRREKRPNGGRYAHRFPDGSEAEMIYVADAADVAIITHTYTPPQHRGQGVAAALVDGRWRTSAPRSAGWSPPAGLPGRNSRRTRNGPTSWPVPDAMNEAAPERRSGATVRIAMWSGPRNLSTALMRSFGNRRDCTVSDEPFYACYLRLTGLAHPMRDEILRHHESDWEKVDSALAGPPPGGKKLWYQKHMTHHMLPEIGRGFMRFCQHAFLIRHPARVLASYAAKREEVTLGDIGFIEQEALFDEVAAMTGEPPPVIDADALLADPPGRAAGALRRARDPLRRGDAELARRSPRHRRDLGLALVRCGQPVDRLCTATPRPGARRSAPQEFGRTGAPDLRAARALRPRLNFALTILSNAFHLACGPVGVPATFMRRIALELLLLPLELRQRQIESRLGGVELSAEFCDGCLEIAAPLTRGAREGRVGEMLFVVDSSPPVLGGDLEVEVGDHAAEFLGHCLDLANLPSTLFDLEPQHADSGVS